MTTGSRRWLAQLLQMLEGLIPAPGGEIVLGQPALDAQAHRVPHSWLTDSER